MATVPEVLTGTISGNALDAMTERLIARTGRSDAILSPNALVVDNSETGAFVFKGLRTIFEGIVRPERYPGFALIAVDPPETEAETAYNVLAFGAVGVSAAVLETTRADIIKEAATCLSRVQSSLELPQ